MNERDARRVSLRSAEGASPIFKNDPGLQGEHQRWGDSNNWLFKFPNHVTVFYAGIWVALLEPIKRYRQNYPRRTACNAGNSATSRMDRDVKKAH